MSRVYRQPAPSPTRRPPVRGAHASVRGAHASVRGRSMPTQRPSLQRNANCPSNGDKKLENQEQRSVCVGEGYHMFTPSTVAREQMIRQAESEQSQYQAHLEQKRLHGIREVHRLGGDRISEEEVRRRQAENYRREKFQRLEKSHQEQMQRKQQEEKEIEAKRQAAREQAIENENRNRNVQLHSMRPMMNQSNQGATSGWTDEDRENDRRETMDRFLNTMTLSSGANKTDPRHNSAAKSEKLSILRDMFPHIDDQTLEYYLETYDGNIDAIVSELAN